LCTDQEPRQTISLLVHGHWIAPKDIQRVVVFKQMEIHCKTTKIKTAKPIGWKKEKKSQKRK